MCGVVYNNSHPPDGSPAASSRPRDGPRGIICDKSCDDACVYYVSQSRDLRYPRCTLSKTREKLLRQVPMDFVAFLVIVVVSDLYPVRTRTDGACTGENFPLIDIRYG